MIPWLAYVRWTHSAYPLLAVVTTVGPFVVLVAIGTAFIRGWFREQHLWILGAIASVLLFVFAKLGYPFDSPRQLWRDTNPFGFLVAIWWVYAIGAPILSARAWRKNPRCSVATTIELTPDELRFSTNEATTTLRWTAIARVAETGGYFLFFYTKTRAGYLPTRVVPPAELPALRRVLAANLDQPLDADTLGLGLEIHEDAMPEHR